MANKFVTAKTRKALRVKKSKAKKMLKKTKSPVKGLLDAIRAVSSPTLGAAERADFQSAIDDLKVEKGALAARVVELEKWIDNARHNGIDFSSAEAVLQPVAVAVPVTVVVDPPKDDTPA